MEERTSVSAFYKTKDVVQFINRKYLHISMAALFIMMAMTVINTVIRKAGIGGIVDAFDMTNLLMICTVYCALAYQESIKGHVRIDMFVDMLPGISSKIVDTILNVLSVAIMAVMFYAYFNAIVPRFHSGSSTQVLKIPEWPFYILVTIGLFLFTLAMLLNTIGAFVPEKKEEPPK